MYDPLEMLTLDFVDCYYDWDEIVGLGCVVFEEEIELMIWVVYSGQY
jgi:hypothetical protein